MTSDLRARIQALIDAIDFDNNGSMVAGQWVGGNGGQISRETTRAVDRLRRALAESDEPVGPAAR